MLKTLFAATTALTLMSGVGFAETTYSNSTTHSTSVAPSHDVDISKTTRRTSDSDGITIEKNKTITKDAARDHDRLMMKDKTATTDFDRDRARDHDRIVAEKEKTVTKHTDVAPNGDMTKSRSETTTVR